MASPKELRANIIIGGKQDPSFKALGAGITELGTQVDKLSSKLIDFGKESVRTYVSYEDAMLDAEVALRTTYNSAGDLARNMQLLDQYAMKWAASSRFATQDVAQGIANAAHAGWDAKEIIEAMPNAMEISLAGGMQLADGLEYLIDITNAAGLSMDQLGQLTDQWAIAANSSSTTIPEMGNAMQRMGASLGFFKQDMAEVTTMLAVLADNGTKGEAAGTLLRNSVIRLIAPTKTAAEAMGGLALTAEDLEEIYADQDSMDRALKWLKEAGFSAYDSAGELKPFMQIFSELDAATKEMTEEKRNDILSAIFPTRTLSGALAFLDAASDGWGGLYETIQNGTDYADYAMETMESGLGGTLRRLEATWNVLQTKSGEALSGPVGQVAELLTGFVNDLNNLDEGTFSAIISGLTVVAGAGPALLAVGGIITGISALIGTGLPGMAAVIALFGGAVLTTIRELEKADYKSLFGDLTLDKEKIVSGMQATADSFREVYGEADRYSEALDAAVSSYQTASSTLKENLLNTMLSGSKLTKEDTEALFALGSQASQAVIEGINASYSADEEMLAALFGVGSDELPGADGNLGELFMALNRGYNSSIEKAQSLSTELRSTMFKAFKDGKLTQDELNDIQAIFDQFNDLVAQQMDEENYIRLAKAMGKSQGLGVDSMNEVVAEVSGIRDSAWETEYTKMLRTRYRMEKEGVSPGALAAYDQQITNARDAMYGQYDAKIFDLYNATAVDSDFGKAWRALNEMANTVIANDGDESVMQREMQQYASKFNDENGTQMRFMAQQFAQQMIDSLGGYSMVQERAAGAQLAGDTATARKLASLLVMSDLGALGTGTAASYQNGFVTGADGGYEVPVTFVPDAEQVESKLGEIEADPLTEKVYGDTSGLASAIRAYDGRSITVRVLGNAGSLGETVRRASVNQSMDKYAEGGRATTESIFGEAGPEWAIPEQHTERTAQLLNAARVASGFSWGELISAGSGASSNVTLNYAPTIYAQDSNGVGRELEKSKEDIMKLLKDKKLRDEVEAFA